NGLLLNRTSPRYRQSTRNAPSRENRRTGYQPVRSSASPTLASQLTLPALCHSQTLDIPVPTPFAPPVLRIRLCRFPPAAVSLTLDLETPHREILLTRPLSNQRYAVANH